MEKISFNPVQMQSDLINISGLYAEFKPSENLRKYICCYWVSPLLSDASINQVETQNREIVIPDGCIDLLFGTDKDGKSCRNILVGTMSRGTAVNMEHNNIQTFGIRFYPGGLQAFINESASEFTDKMELIDTIGQDILIEFTKEISKIADISNKISFANRYFTLKMKVFIPWEDKFQNMLYHIYNSKGIIQVKDIAQREAISEKQVTRILYNRVGVGAKTFIKTIRFQNALKMINTKKTVRIVDAALEAGYYDQSHFIHDFYAFSSVNPSEYSKKIIKP